jgi:hypothetical protein
MSKTNRLPALEHGPKRLELTDEEFHELHVRLDKTRRTSATVAVDRLALTRLLGDHGKLYAHLSEIEGALRYGQT